MNVSFSQKSWTVEGPDYINMSRRTEGKENGRADRDKNIYTLTSVVAKPNNIIIRDLMEQKQELAERRADYLDSAQEKGTDPTVIREKLHEFDTKIQELESQIRQIQLEEQSKAFKTGETEEEKQAGNNSMANNVQENEEEVTDKRKDLFASNAMSSVLSARMELRNIEGIKKAQSVLRTEALSVKERNPGRSETLSKKADDLDKKIEEIEKDINDKISRASEKDVKESYERNKRGRIEEKGKDAHKDGQEIFEPDVRDAGQLAGEKLYEYEHIAKYKTFLLGQKVDAGI